MCLRVKSYLFSIIVQYLNYTKFGILRLLIYKRFIYVIIAQSFGQGFCKFMCYKLVYLITN